MRKRTTPKQESFEGIHIQRFVALPSRDAPLKRERTNLELPRIFPLHTYFRPRLDRLIYDLFVEPPFSLNQRFNKDDPQDISTIETQSKTIICQRSARDIFFQRILAPHKIASLSFQPKVKVWIQEGNNSRLIHQLMRRRTQVKIIQSKKDADIIWTRFCDWEATTFVSRFTQTERKVSETIQIEGNETKKRSLKHIVVSDLKMHNHLHGHHQISDKKSLFRNLLKYCQIEKLNQRDFIPQTYHIEKNFQQLSSEVILEGRLWVVKPGEDTNQGTGVSIEQGKIGVQRAVGALMEGGKTAIIQQYIDPMLYRGRKFDIRCYVLVTSFRGVLKAYWYREGYLRTCSKQFTKEASNYYGHLTNDAVQKHSKDYGKFEPYNKLSFSELQTMLGTKDISLSNVIERFKSIARLSIKAVEDKLKADKNMFGFEIFGYDFLLDSLGKPWLIEINTNPCLEFAGSLLARIIWHMVQNALAIVLDPFLKFTQKSEKIYEQTKFECII